MLIIFTSALETCNPDSIILMADKNFLVWIINEFSTFGK